MYFLNPVNKSYCLQQLCESNYGNLMRLVPGLIDLRGTIYTSVAGKPDLCISIIDRSPYTRTIELNHCFEKNLQEFLAPAVRIRVYLDVKSVEVLCDQHRLHIERVSRKSSMLKEIMEYKWTLNCFLEKWLTHCLKLGYQFNRLEGLEAATL